MLRDTNVKSILVVYNQIMSNYSKNNYFKKPLYYVGNFMLVRLQVIFLKFYSEIHSTAYYFMMKMISPFMKYN